MPLTSDVKPFHIKALVGMNAKIEDLELNDKFVEVAQNCRFEGQPGAVDKRLPITYYNGSTLGTGAILGLYRYYSKGGTIKSITVHGTTTYVGDDSAGTFAAIRTNLTTGKRMAFLTYKDIIIMSNGYDNPFCYDGSTDNVTWELGAGKAVTAAGGANLDASAAYYYAVTIDDGAYISGAVSNTVTTGAAGGNRKVTLTNLPTGPVGYTNLKLYRTEGGGSTLKLLATFDNTLATPAWDVGTGTATTYTDDVADASLGATMGAVTDDMPKGSILKLHRERLFMAGDPNYPNRIYYSNPYLPWYIQQTTNLDYMEIDADDGDTIMGIPIQLGVMVCVKKNTIRKLYITSATSGADPETWYAEDPIAFTGSPAQWSIVQTQHGVVFLGWDHWKLFDGASVKDIIDEFDTDDILPGLYNQVFSYWLQDDVLLVGYSDSTVATKYNNRLMRFNFKRQALSYDTISANCISANTGDNETGDVLIGDSANGFVYKAERSDIYYKLLTKTQADAGTENDTFVGGTESSPTIQIGAITSAAAIVSDICILWDDPITTPGANWTEITDKNDKFIRITDDDVGTTGTVSLSDVDEMSVSYLKLRCFKHSSGTEYEFPVGSIVMYGTDGTPEGWVDYDAGGAYVQISSTPGIGSALLPILRPDPWVTAHDYVVGDYVKESTDVYICLIAHTSGVFATDLANLKWEVRTASTNFDQTIALRFMKKVGESSSWDGVSNYAYALYYAAGAPGNGFTDVTSTYDNDYLVSGASVLEAKGDTTTGSADPIQSSATNHTYGSGNTGVGENTIDGDVATYQGHAGGDYATGSGGSFASGATVMSQHDFVSARTITSITYRAYVYTQSNSSTDNAHYAYIDVEYNVGGVWTAFTGGDVSGGASGDGSSTIGSSSASTTITQTVENVIGVRVKARNTGSYHNSDGNHTWDCRIYEVSCVSTPASYVTFRLVKKILGQMKDYNTAIATPYYYGTWVSPGIQISAETMGSMYWNESKIATDEINVYTRTGATQASVEDGTAITTVDHTAEKFTLISHGLSNTDRITLDATVMPTGLVKTRVYYVVGVSGADFQVSYTSAGAVVPFTSNGTAVTFKKWSSTVLSDPNGSAIGSSASTWIQYLIAFIAADSTVSNPQVYFIGGYALQFAYARGASNAEAAVEFIYRTGYRHFDDQWMDKIFKKILTYHTGEQGQMLIKWNTENASGTLTCDLSVLPSRFESFFPDTAFGRKLNIEVYKNDLYDLKLKEFAGMYTPEPILI